MRELTFYSLSDRQNKVSIKDFAKTPRGNASFSDFFESLPGILAGQDIKELVAAIHKAKSNSRLIIVMMKSMESVEVDNG